MRSQAKPIRSSIRYGGRNSSVPLGDKTDVDQAVAAGSISFMVGKAASRTLSNCDENCGSYKGKR